MATNCVKNGKVEDGKRSQRAYEAAQQEREIKTNETIEACVQGNISVGAARAELCRLYDDPDRLQTAVNRLEEAKGSGIVAGKVSIERPLTGGRIMSYVDNHDDVVAFMITPKGDTIPMVPNNAYYAGVVGGQVTYTDHHGGIYKTAQKAAEAKVGQEDGTNIITKGNCGEGTAPVPNWVPEKKAQGVAAKGTALQGDIGERIAADVCVNKLSLTPMAFDDRPKGTPKGFDQIYTDKDQIVVVVESKNEDVFRLSKLTTGETQLEPAYIEKIARQMTTPGSPYYTETNAKAGQAILDAGVENVRAIAIHTNPKTLVTTVYERKGETWTDKEIVDRIEHVKKDRDDPI
jgi:hypothetical protein